MIRSIRSRLTLIFISLAVIPLLVLGLILTWQTFGSEKQHAVNVVRETARRVGTEVCSFLNEVVSHLEIIVHVRGLSGLTPIQQKHMLEELLAFNNEFDDLSLLNEDGHETIRVSRTHLDQNRKLIDFSERPEFKRAASTHKKSFSDVLFSERTGEPYMIVSIPFFNVRQNSLQGVLVAHVRLKKIWDLIIALKLQKGEDIYILDNHGHIIAHRNPSIVLRRTQIALPTTTDQTPDSKIGLNHTSVIQAHYPIPLGEEKLIVIAEQSEDEALKLAQNLLKTFLAITFFALAAAITLIVVITGNIVKPIQNLVHVARDIMQGNISSKAEIVMDDEIGELAQTFNKMTDQLHTSLDKLHLEIEEKTTTQMALEKELKTNESFTTLSEELLGTASIDSIASLVLDSGRQLTASKYGFASAMDPKTGKIIFHSLTNFETDQCQVPSADKIGTSKQPSVIGNALFHDHTHIKFEPFFINDISEHAEHAGIMKFPEGHISVQRFLSVPVIINEKLAGQIAVANADTDYNEKDIAVLEQIARLYALAISRYRSQTEREQLSSALRQAQKMEAIGTLAGGIAHDFNNILTPILGYAEIIDSQLPPGSDLSQDIEQILSATHRASQLVNQILTFSRQREHDRINIEIHLIIKEALKLLRSTIPTSIEIRQEIDTQSGSVLADPTQIHQIVMNLCTNAYHAMQPKGGILAVSLHPVFLETGDIADNKLNLLPGHYLQLEVSDTGSGIPKEIMERIFDPYFSTKTEGRGTGLGLSVVHGIVEAHGGAITVYSEPDKGTTFHVYLPLSDTKTDLITEEERLKSLPTGNEKLLIVDDEESVLRLEKRMIEKLGYEVTSTMESATALKIFTSHPDNFDLVITDMTMPKMNGAELAESIIAIKPDMPIIICTGYSELINLEKAREIGIKGYLEKPIILQNLALTIRRVLDGNEIEI
ncbi:MAG: response regulator [Desulfobulbaceae bacterium]|nr:response regulator [Desulfobulbaceae bacterium]